MKEILLYVIVALSSLFILGFSIHMFVGGLVARETEHRLIIGGCLIGATVIAFMAWDIVRRRKGS